MSSRRHFGGRRALWWAPAAALLAANVAWLFLFGSGSRLRAADLGRRLEAAKRDNAALSARLAAREQLWIAATENRTRLDALYESRFATERARFTEMVRELKGLAQSAGLEPSAISYPEEQLEEYGLVRRSFVFGANGSYEALRNFLNLIEVSPSFLVVEQIDVGESSRGLGVQLRLSTLFRAVGSDAAGAPPADAGETPAAGSTAPAAAAQPGTDGEASP